MIHYVELRFICSSFMHRLNALADHDPKVVLEVTEEGLQVDDPDVAEGQLVSLHILNKLLLHMHQVFYVQL